MPWVNAKGDVIPERVQTDEARALRKLEYPRDKAAIRHLSRRAFYVWLYGMDPLSSLLLASAPEGEALVGYQYGKRWYHEAADGVWRFFHGR